MPVIKCRCVAASASGTVTSLSSLESRLSGWHTQWHHHDDDSATGSGDLERSVTVSASGPVRRSHCHSGCQWHGAGPPAASVTDSRSHTRAVRVSQAASATGTGTVTV